MMTKVNGTRYEFIFIRLEPVLGVSREMVDLVGAVCKAYVSTRLNRDLRLRSAILAVSSKQLKMLQSEQIYSSVGGVWNLSSDQGNLGTMYLTNVRVVWHANMNELFNISLPFIQVMRRGYCEIELMIISFRSGTSKCASPSLAWRWSSSRASRAAATCSAFASTPWRS